MSLQLAHVVGLILAARALEDLVLLVAHQMFLKGLGRGEVLDRAELDGAAAKVWVVPPDMLQQGSEAVEYPRAAIA